jgi:hypothetical protein
LVFAGYVIEGRQIPRYGVGFGNEPFLYVIGSEPMKFYLKLVMKGNFPDSPDTDSKEITEAEYDELYDKYFQE